MLSLSGHYNTQLGLLSALQLDKYQPASNFTWFASIPKLAALMVFELHYVNPAAITFLAGSNPSYFVRLVYQNGPLAPYETVPLPCATVVGSQVLSPGTCMLEDFLLYASMRAINSSAAWCSACDNFSPNSCAAAQLQVMKAAALSGGDKDAWPWRIAVAVVVTFIGTMALTLAGVWLWGRRRLAGHHTDAVGGSASGRLDGEMMKYVSAPGTAI